MIAVSVNTFENPNGKRVVQAFNGGMPITRELEVDDPRAMEAARRVFEEHYGKATLSLWDAEAGARVVDSK